MYASEMTYLTHEIRFNIFTARKRSLGQGNIFTPVCHSVHRGGRAWLLQGGACVVALGEGGCAWLLQEGGHVHGCSGGGVHVGGHV